MDQDTLYLMPRESVPGEGIVAPALTELIRIEGQIDYDGPVDQPVRGLTFEGLTFMHGDRWTWQRDKQGWGLQHDWEMFDRPTAMVRLRGAEDCTFDSCRWAHCGSTGVQLDLHCQRNAIRNSLFEQLGGGGVLLAGYGPGTKDVNHHNQIINCHIRCDNDQHETIWENNVVVRSTGEGSINKGKNTFRNNVFAAIRSKTDAGIENTHSRGFIVMPSENPQGAVYQRNVFLADERDRRIVHHGIRPNRRRGGSHGGWIWECDSDYNVFWNTEDPDWAKRYFAEVRPKGSDENSIAANPGFVDWRTDNFLLKPDAAARRVGFQGIDVTNCGLTDDFPDWLR